jgi:hypothetical protein
MGLLNWFKKKELELETNIVNSGENNSTTEKIDEDDII